MRHKGKEGYFDLEFGIGDISTFGANLVIRICWFCWGSPHFWKFFFSIPTKYKKMGKTERQTNKIGEEKKKTGTLSKDWFSLCQTEKEKRRRQSRDLKRGVQIKDKGTFLVWVVAMCYVIICFLFTFHLFFFQLDGVWRGNDFWWWIWGGIVWSSSLISIFNCLLIP